MSDIATTPILDKGKTVAYVVPVDDFNRYKELEELEEQENAELAKIAQVSIDTGFASKSEVENLFAEILR